MVRRRRACPNGLWDAVGWNALPRLPGTEEQARTSYCRGCTDAASRGGDNPMGENLETWKPGSKCCPVAGSSEEDRQGRKRGGVPGSSRDMHNTDSYLFRMASNDVDLHCLWQGVAWPEKAQMRPSQLPANMRHAARKQATRPHAARENLQQGRDSQKGNGLWPAADLGAHYPRIVLALRDRN